MLWIPCSVIECSGFHEARPNATWLNAVDFMHRDSVQLIPCSVNKWNPNECSRFMQHNWMQWIPAGWLNAVDLCSMAKSIQIECSGFHAPSLNAEDSMHCGAMDPDCMQWSPCSEALCIPIECRWFYAAWPKSSRLNAVDSMQHDWMKWILCSMANSIGLNAVDSMQRHWMQWIPCIGIKCSVIHEAW